MEDAATAEISRSQLWQWVNNDNAKLTDGRSVDKDLYREVAPQVLADIKARVGEEAYNQGQIRTRRPALRTAHHRRQLH